MGTIFDILSMMLLIAAAALLLLRWRHEHPDLAPYAIIGLVAAVGNWLGNNGGGLAAVAFLIAGAFLMLHLAGLPYPEDGEEKASARK